MEEIPNFSFSTALSSYPVALAIILGTYNLSKGLKLPTVTIARLRTTLLDSAVKNSVLSLTAILKKRIFELEQSSNSILKSVG